MPLALRYRFNACFTSLIDGQTPKFDVVPVRLKDGDWRRVKWLGFIDVEEARQLPGAKPVKLLVAYYSANSGAWPHWHPVPEGKAVQGCAAAGGVYAVLQGGAPRLTEIGQAAPHPL